MRAIWMLLLPLGLLLVSGCSRSVAGGRADGPAIFAEVCARCHGHEGVPPPEMVAQLGVENLTTAEFHQRATDESIRERVESGSPKGMPGFSGTLSADQITAVVAHVRGLAR